MGVDVEGGVGGLTSAKLPTFPYLAVVLNWFAIHPIGKMTSKKGVSVLKLRGKHLDMTTPLFI
jgi:hypothetical protein